MVQVKICGLTSKSAIDTTIAEGAAFAGFVFFPASPRHLTKESAEILVAYAKGRIKTVGVFADPADDYLAEILSTVKLDYLQLHGKESVERVQAIGRAFPHIGIIKAFAVRCSDDIAHASAYEPYVDYLLFDARAPGSALPGGNGLSFDWNLLKHRKFSRPWLLAGGIHEGNVAEAAASSGAGIVDISSSVESAPGLKDSSLIRRFMEQAKQA